MIVPTKYLDLDTSLIRVAALTLSTLREMGAVPYRELNQRVEDELGDDARLNLPPALGLLYTLGQIDYDPGADAVVSLRNPMSVTEEVE